MAAAAKISSPNLWYERGTERHEVIYIEYQNRRPHSVVTLHHWDHRGKPWFNPARDTPTGTCPHYWDFDWCKRDRTAYYHNSGIGGDNAIQVHRFCNPSPPPGELWVADGITLVRHNERAIRSDSALLKMGYRRLKRPRLLTTPRGEKTRNPFDAGEPTDTTIYCRVCRDRLPEDGWGPPCDHLEWCDECSAWVYAATADYHDSYGDGKCEHFVTKLEVA
jgi:hypothetical protein